MKNDGQMFLLGAVLLSAVFFATAALQSSTPFVVQDANQLVSSVPSNLGELQEIEAAIRAECTIFDDNFAEHEQCSESIGEYWSLQTGNEIVIQVQCLSLFLAEHTITQDNQNVAIYIFTITMESGCLL